MVVSSYDRGKEKRERKSELQEDIEKAERKRLEHESFQSSLQNSGNATETPPDDAEEESQEDADTERAARLYESQNQARQGGGAVDLAKEKLKEKAKEEVTKQVKRVVERRAAQAAASAAGEAGAAAAGSVIASTAPIWGSILAIIGAIIGIIALIIIVIMATCNDSWATRWTSTAASWAGILPEDVCAAFSVESGGSGSTGGAGASREVPYDQCTDAQKQELALQNNVPYPAQRAPELDTLISCITTQVAAMGYTQADLGSIFTYENRNPSCNYTRGQDSLEPLCGVCIHTQFSCHYGGREGTSGSLAVDFGLGDARNNALYTAVTNAATACNAGFILDEGDHLHVSTTSCDTDGAGDF